MLNFLEIQQDSNFGKAIWIQGWNKGKLKSGAEKMLKIET